MNLWLYDLCWWWCLWMITEFSNISWDVLEEWNFLCSNVSCGKFVAGCVIYLGQMSYTPVRPGILCGLDNTILFAASMCSTLLIVSMTFERFYSIIRSHRAAYFNTVKRAKITIVCILIFSTLYNIPHTFITLKIGRQCIPYGKALEHTLGLIYYYLSLVISFFLPFILLLIMNSFIIHTLHARSDLLVMKSDSEEYNSKGQGHKMKNSEKQIFITLLFVTFAFLILNTPAYALFPYVMVYDNEQSPKSFAGYTLFKSIGRNM